MQDINQQLQDMAANLKSQTTLALDQATANQAQAAKCVGTAGITSRLVVENGAFSLANTSTAQSLGIVVHKNNQKGAAGINHAAPDETKQAVSRALELAKFSLEDPYLNLATPEMAPPAQSLSFLYDHEVGKTSMLELGEVMKAVLEVFKEEPRFSLDRFELQASLGYHTLHNSHGVRQEELQSTVHWDFLGMAVDGEHVSGMDYDSGFSFNKDFKDQVIAEARALSQRTVALLKPQKCPAYKGPVLIASRALNDLLLGTLLFHASGRAVMDGKSRWADKVGEKVVSDKLIIRDEPHHNRLGGATAYDSDGLPTQQRTLFDKGVLTQHLYDCYSAKKLGKKPTATSGGPFGLVMDPGDQSFAALTGAAPQLLYVTRFSGNLDPLTGDFSGLAKSSRFYKAGVDQGPVGETMIAGNVFDLANQVLGVCDQQEYVSGHMLCPAVLVDGVSVS